MKKAKAEKARGTRHEAPEESAGNRAVELLLGGRLVAEMAQNGTSLTIGELEKWAEASMVIPPWPYDHCSRVLDALIDLGIILPGGGVLDVKLHAMVIDEAAAAAVPAASQSSISNPQSTITEPPPFDAAQDEPAAMLAAQPAAPPKADLAFVPIDAILCEDNYRQYMDEAFIAQLQASMQELGIMQPVVVCKADKKFRLIFGFQRLEAAKRNGETLIEAKVYPTLPPELIERMHLTENVLRTDPSHMDLARRFGRSRAIGLTNVQIAKLINQSDDFVRKHFDLLRLCEPVQRLVADGRLPLKQAELICRVGDAAGQIELAERCLQLDWDTQASTWKPGDAPYGTPEDAPAGDHVGPMEDLRKSVEYHLCGLAACGWLKQEQRTGVAFKGADDRGRCLDCLDNTTTYAEQPALFAGIHPRGAATRGYCTNKACYEAKSTAWACHKQEDAKAAAERTAAEVRKAQRAGLTVCEGCNRVDAGELVKHQGKQLCPACLVKAQKAAKKSGGRNGDNYDLHRAENAKLRKAFPWTAEQKLTVALFDRIGALADACRIKVKAGKAPAVERAAGVLVALFNGDYRDPIRVKGIPGGLDAAKGKKIPDAVMAEAIRQALSTSKHSRPSWPEYGDTAYNVPIDKRTEAALELAEGVATAWKIELKHRPKLADFTDDMDPLESKAKPVASGKAKKSPAKAGRARPAKIVEAGA